MTAIGYFGPASANAGDQTLWMPMIRFSLSNAVLPEDEHIVAQDLVALIDTGSDYCRIDERIAETHNLYRTRNLIRARNDGKEYLNQTFLCQVILQDLTKLHLICAAFKLRGDGGAAFDFLLGMDAIRQFDLSVIRSEERVTLRYLGKS
jgi:predicted aspartyl protease